MAKRTIRASIHDMDWVVESLVRETIEYNTDAMEANLKEAAELANDHLWSFIPPIWRHADGYHTGWTVAHEAHPYTERYVVHNNIKPSLTHLLENGHEMWLFGHYTGRRVPAYKHIAPAYEYALSRMSWRVS